jgi:hypothetical protein
MKPGVRIGVALGLVLLLAPAAPAADRQAIQQAVDRGVAFLRGAQGGDGIQASQQMGATALAGLALLECDVPADDPAVRNAAKAVRAASVSCTNTYSLALGIMFLDRLGDAADAELIESMAVRLLAGQHLDNGGWNYDCPPLAGAEAQRLQQGMRQQDEPAARPAPPLAGKGRPSVQDLPKEIQQQLQVIDNRQRAAVVTPAARGGTDNSNTQFAAFALWIARRKGIPVEAALRRLDARFRTTQLANGRWEYAAAQGDEGGGYGPSLSMLCAGLMALAVAHGSALEAAPAAAPARGVPPVEKDPAVRNALLALGAALPAPGPAGAPPNDDAIVIDPNRGNASIYYFFFSLERTAAVMGLETIGHKDWYAWGADYLVRHQNRDGSWTAEFAASRADTCFALLFLRRSNLAPDLTTTLRGRVQDPGQRQLRAIDLDNVDRGGGATRPAGPPPADAEVGRLSDELVKAGAGQQEQALRKLRDGKGTVYTEALAHAIHRLDGPVKEKARDALADRLARMTAATLRDKLGEDDAEVRRAAALACAMKEERAHVGRLIELLQDPEAPVARAAHAALKSLTGQDLGPPRDAGKEDVARAVAAWKDWWRKNGEK